jgi:hypothetical protein
MKPIDIPRLLEQIGHLLKIAWQHESALTAEPIWSPNSETPPPPDAIEELIALGRLGHVRAIQVKLDDLQRADPQHTPFAVRMRALVDRFDLNAFMSALEGSHSHDR